MPVFYFQKQYPGGEKQQKADIMTGAAFRCDIGMWFATAWKP
jgi:hypothetical protein